MAPTRANLRASFGEAAKLYGVEPLITDDYLEVEAAVRDLHPELVLGTQMERHIAKRLGIPCAVISSPIHVQDFPARYSPQMGYEGANVLFDTWVHPLMMGLEEHLLGMFREDFEFHAEAAPSHLAAVSTPAAVAAQDKTGGNGEATPAVEAAKPKAPPRLSLQLNPLNSCGAPKRRLNFAKYPSSCEARRNGTPNGSQPSTASPKSR